MTVEIVPIPFADAPPLRPVETQDSVITNRKMTLDELVEEYPDLQTNGRESL